MRGEQANYTIPLKKSMLFPQRIRIRKAIAEIRDFVKKHTRMKRYVVSNEVNSYLHTNSKNLPRRIRTVFLREKDRIMIFLEGGEEMEAYKKKFEAAKKKKEDKKSGAKVTEARTKEMEEEKKKKLEDKKAKEEAAKAADLKRGMA